MQTDEPLLVLFQKMLIQAHSVTLSTQIDNVRFFWGEVCYCKIKGTPISKYLSEIHQSQTIIVPQIYFSQLVLDFKRLSVKNWAKFGSVTFEASL